MNFVEELKWRGMVHTMMPGTEELFEKGIVTAYLGIDPTADSLHIGHLCGVMMLRHFQRCGHKPIALLGGATGMIGDPSGKSQERNLLDENTLRHNQECIKKQLSKFLDFDSDAPNHAELVNNYDWMKDFSFLDFARTVGKHITVNYMMAKDSVQKRLAKEVTVMVHSEADYEAAVEASNILFGNSTSEQLHKLDEDTLLAVFEGVPQFEISRDTVLAGIPAVELTTEVAAIFPSKGEMRKLTQGGGVSINKEKLAAPDTKIDATYLLNNKYIIVQRGKKNYYLLIAK